MIVAMMCVLLSIIIVSMTTHILAVITEGQPLNMADVQQGHALYIDKGHTSTMATLVRRTDAWREVDRGIMVALTLAPISESWRMLMMSHMDVTRATLMVLFSALATLNVIVVCVCTLSCTIFIRWYFAQRACGCCRRCRQM